MHQHVEVDRSAGLILPPTVAGALRGSRAPGSDKAEEGSYADDPDPYGAGEHEDHQQNPYHLGEGPRLRSGTGSRFLSSHPTGMQTAGEPAVGTAPAQVSYESLQALSYRLRIGIHPGSHGKHLGSAGRGPAEALLESLHRRTNVWTLSLGQEPVSPCLGKVSHSEVDLSQQIKDLLARWIGLKETVKAITRLPQATFFQVLAHAGPSRSSEPSVEP
jgi:hypothetical protein